MNILECVRVNQACVRNLACLVVRSGLTAAQFHDLAKSEAWPLDHVFDFFASGILLGVGGGLAVFFLHAFVESTQGQDFNGVLIGKLDVLLILQHGRMDSPARASVETMAM